MEEARGDGLWATVQSSSNAVLTKKGEALNACLHSKGKATPSRERGHHLKPIIRTSDTTELKRHTQSLGNRKRHY